MQEITYVYTRTETPISWRSTKEVFYSNTVQHWQYGIHTWLAGLWMLFSRRVETTHAEMSCSLLVVTVVTISMCFWQYHHAWRSLLCFVLIRSTWCDCHSFYRHGPHLHCCGGDDPPHPAVLLAPVSTRHVPDYNLPIWFNTNAIIGCFFVFVFLPFNHHGKISYKHLI